MSFNALEVVQNGLVVDGIEFLVLGKGLLVVDNVLVVVDNRPGGEVNTVPVLDVVGIALLVNGLVVVKDKFALVDVELIELETYVAVASVVIVMIGVGFVVNNGLVCKVGLILDVVGTVVCTYVVAVRFEFGVDAVITVECEVVELLITLWTHVR